MNSRVVCSCDLEPFHSEMGEADEADKRQSRHRRSGEVVSVDVVD